MPLIVVPTPIGNLGDMTFRGIEALKDADIVACEDTRVTSRLLNHFGVKSRLVSYHEHNEKARASYLMDLLREGKKIALVSDAGTPGVSDPGHIIIKAAIDEDLSVDILPGANAIIPALLFSGFKPQPFTFGGFLPDKKGDRLKYLESFKLLPWVMVFYISPHKAERHISDILRVLGDRRCALSREISKIYQETLRSSLSELLSEIQTAGIRGELVIAVEGSGLPAEPDENEWRGQALELLAEGMSVKDITRCIEKEYNLPRNRIKKFLLGINE